MKAAILAGGPSLRDLLPFDCSAYSILVVVNHAGELVPNHDHWAALDWEVPAIRRKLPHWRIDWGGMELRANTKLLERDEFGTRPGALTFPLALEKLIAAYDPETIDAFGVDLDGTGLSGKTKKPSKWDLEKNLLAKLDLSRVNWHGKWHP